MSCVIIYLWRLSGLYFSSLKKNYALEMYLNIKGSVRLTILYCYIFRLYFEYLGEPKRFFTQSGSWVCYALNHGVEKLIVSIKMQFSRGVIDVIFQNNNLVELCIYFYDNLYEIEELG